MTRRRAGVAIALAALVLVSCGGAEPAPAPGAPSTESTATSAPGASAPSTSAAPPGLVAAACAGALEVTSAGRVAAEAGGELSGIVASRAQPGVHWVHNDSGAGPEVYAIDEQGALVGTFALDAPAIDWEDIAIGRDLAGHEWSLVVGDIGDNAEARPSVQLHIVAEPEVDPPGAEPGPSPPITDVVHVALTYPDKPHNAEALLVDPNTGQLVIITKELTGPAQVFVADGAALVDGATVTLAPAGSADFGRVALSSWVTAADISADGSVIAVRTYGGVHLFARAEGQSVAEALRGTPCEGPTPLEAQGEAIAISADSRSYLTVSEGAEPILHRTG